MECTCPHKWLNFFRAIHNAHRQKILDIIKKHKEINANGILKKVKLSQPTVSHHLKILADASIIHVKKVGKEAIYSINKKSIHECCEGFADKFTK